MKFIVSSSYLLKSLSAISGVVSSSNTLPICDCFLFRLNKKDLKIQASDLETCIETSLTVESSAVGDIAIPARLLLDTLKTFPDQPLTFSIDPKKFSVEILTEHGKYKLAGHDGGDFPKMAEIEKPSSFEMDGAIMARVLGKTLFAVGNDDLRPVMTGIFVKVSAEGITFVTTDAHKLVKYQRSDVKSKTESSFILPKKPVNLLKSMVVDGKIKTEYNATNVSFSFGGTKIVTRLIDGKYPNYDAVIPTGHPNLLTIDRESFLHSIRRVSVFSNKQTYQVKLNLSKDSVGIQTEDIDHSNEAAEKVDCQYKGENMEIAFNGKFLLEMLSTMDTEEVVFELGTPNKAGIMKPTGKEDILMLIMPVMLNN